MLSSNLKQEAPLHFNRSAWDKLSLMCLSAEMIHVLKIRLIQAEKQQDKFFTSYTFSNGNSHISEEAYRAQIQKVDSVEVLIRIALTYQTLLQHTTLIKGGNTRRSGLLLVFFYILKYF